MELDLELHGANGYIWNVHGPRAGAQGVALLKGSSGFWEAPVNAVWMQGAFQEGATYMGYRVEPIDPVLTIGVRASSHSEWSILDSQLLAGLGTPDQEFKLVSNSESGRRELSLRITQSPETVDDTDITSQHLSRYIVQARGGWPRWVGTPDTSTFTSDTGTGSGTVTVSNPTDTWLYPQWVCDAPGKWTLPDFDWEGGVWVDRTVTTPTLVAGQDLTIDTYPSHEPYVAADGSNIAGRFNGVMFLFPIPPHTPPTDIPVSVTGGEPGASCQLRMPRNWRRPRGGDLL